jgi:hypothetical protein
MIPRRTRLWSYEGCLARDWKYHVLVDPLGCRLARDLAYTMYAKSLLQYSRALYCPCKHEHCTPILSVNTLHFYLLHLHIVNILPFTWDIPVWYWNVTFNNCSSEPSTIIFRLDKSIPFINQRQWNMGVPNAQQLFLSDLGGNWPIVNRKFKINFKVVIVSERILQPNNLQWHTFSFILLIWFITRTIIFASWTQDIIILNLQDYINLRFFWNMKLVRGWSESQKWLTEIIRVQVWLSCAPRP